MTKKLNIYGRFVLLLLLGCIFGFTSADAQNVTSINIIPESAELEIGATLQLSLSIEPTDAQTEIEWLSGDPSIAKVDGTGEVTAVSAGLAIIYAMDGDGVTGFATIKVKDNRVISIEVTPEKSILELGESTQLEASVTPSNATSPITWSSHDTSIAEVDGQGVVTAVGKGTTFIFARSDNGVAGVATVTVIDSNEVISITINPEYLELTAGEEWQMEVMLQPSTSSPEITWISSDASVVEVSESGLVTALNPGVAVVYAVAESGMTGFSTVRVMSNEVTSIILDPDNLTLMLDETARLTAILEPASAETELTWTVTDPTVATVDDQGVVTAKEPGITFVYATSDNGVTGLAVVRVVDPNAEDYDPDHGYGENGAFVSTVRIREGDMLGLFAERPTGFENNDWTYEWYLNGVLAADGKYAVVTAGEDSGWQGNVKEIIAQEYEVDIFNGIGDELILQLPKVSVYSRPLTPPELLKKGDGVSYSFVAMSQFTDKELQNLGYSFVFGYTDGDGVNHVISNSKLRYCHTTKDIYENSQYKFWVYTAWTFPDGATITSGLRYLDGTLDEDFDRSDFNLSRASHVNAPGSDAETAIYTLSGNYVGKDPSRLAPGFYIISERKGNHHTTRKIIKR